MLNNRELGAKYEQMAISYLEGIGMKIICKNFRCKIGEIDIIALDEHYTVFIEVKYRTDLKKGDPSEAINYFKQRIISKVASFYLLKNKLWEYTPCRFDAIVILKDQIRHIKNAFDAV
jgi:putative endonuclease